MLKPILFILTISLLFNPILSVDYEPWTVGISKLPSAAYRMVIGYDYANDTILLIGGHNGSTYLKRVTEYNINNDDFINRPQHALFHNINGGGQYYSQLGAFIYIISESGAFVHRFDILSRTMYNNYYTIPISISFYGCLASIDVDDGYLVVLGGRNHPDSLADVNILNLTDNQWLSNVPSMNNARSAFSCIAHNNEQLYAISGAYYNPSTIYLDSIEVLDVTQLTDISSMQWEYTLHNLSRPMESTMAVINKNDVVIIGGFNFWLNTYMNEINVIDTTTNSVAIRGYIDIGRESISVINVNNVIYAFGGFPYTDSWRYIDLSTMEPSNSPSSPPSNIPSSAPSLVPTKNPTQTTRDPTLYPTVEPTTEPTSVPTAEPTTEPTAEPTTEPTSKPTYDPTLDPTNKPTYDPTNEPTYDPTPSPTGVSSTEVLEVVLDGDFDDLLVYLDENDIELNTFALNIIETLMDLPNNPRLNMIIVKIIEVRSGSIIIRYSLSSDYVELLNEAISKIDESVHIDIIYNKDLTFTILSNEKYNDDNTDNSYQVENVLVYFVTFILFLCF